MVFYEGLSKIGQESAEDLSALKIVGKFDRIDQIGFGVSTVLSVWEGYENVKKGNIRDAVKNGVNIVIGVIGTFGGPVGAAVSAVYFIGDFFEWWYCENEIWC